MQDEAEIENRKHALRTEALARRHALTPSERAAHSIDACHHLCELVSAHPNKSVALYWPIRDEIDSKPALVRLVEEGVPILLPAVLGEHLPLQFRLWEPGTPLYEAGFGTLAPPDTAPRPDPEIVVIPLAGFDASGTRLGYGKGFYDRTLAQFKQPPLIVGFAFSAQEIEHIPAAPHDVPMQWVVTERGSRKIGN